MKVEITKELEAQLRTAAGSRQDNVMAVLRNNAEAPAPAPKKKSAAKSSD